MMVSVEISEEVLLVSEQMVDVVIVSVVILDILMVSEQMVDVVRVSVVILDILMVSQQMVDVVTLNHCQSHTVVC